MGRRGEQGDATSVVEQDGLKVELIRGMAGAVHLADPGEHGAIFPTGGCHGSTTGGQGIERDMAGGGSFRPGRRKEVGSLSFCWLDCVMGLLYV